MLKKLFAFLRDLFGDGATETEPAPAQAAPAPPDVPVSEPPVPTPVHEEEAEAEAASPTPGVDLPLHLQRAPTQPTGTPGTLSLKGQKLADTLEGNHDEAKPEQTLLKPGTYPIHLATEGGKHATYLYRFGETHKGIMMLGETGNTYLPSLHMGYRAEHLYGSILLGTHTVSPKDNSLRLTDSESAYLEVYKVVVEALAAGESVALIIQE